MFSLNSLLQGDRTSNEDHIRSLCQTVALEPGTTIARVLGRWKMFVEPHDLAISVHLMFDGYWEMWLTEEIARVVGPGMVVADVGANLGYFSLLMADLVGSAGRVLAFEPNPRVAELLRRSLLANGFSKQVEICPYPLSDAAGHPVTLHFNHEQPGGAFIAEVARDDHQVALSLNTQRFDDHPDAMRVAVAKIDAEGSEEAIWTGMKGMVAQGALRTVFMEWCAFRYGDPAQFLAALTAPGFSLGALDPVRGIQPITAAEILAASPLQEWMLVLRR